jgi:isopenicillin-N epimerase
VPGVSRRSVLAGIATGVAARNTFAAARPQKPPVEVSPDALATDERYWRSIASHYEVTSEVVQLENGNWGICTQSVLAAYERQLQAVNRRNSFYVRREFAGDYERIRARIAAALGVDSDEIALTRGATEALQALIGGYNGLRPGDAVLYCDLDYDSMQSAMNWLTARRGVEVVRIALPEPATYQGLIDAYAAALDAHPRVRLILLTHLSHRTGLVLPIKEIVAMARARGVDAIVDSAHAWGQIDFSVRDLGMDFAGFNLHKWMGAPLGVGVLYIRRARIAQVDVFMASDEHSPDDVQARVHSGTTNFAAFLTVPDALNFQETIGIAAKEARLRYLRDLWAERLRGHGRLEVLTPSDRRLHGGITSFRLKDRTSAADNVALAKQLLDQFGIFSVHRTGVAAGACVRITPAMFTSRDHIDRLVHALEAIAA